MKIRKGLKPGKSVRDPILQSPGMSSQRFTLYLCTEIRRGDTEFAFF